MGLFMAWGIGANDVANAMATSVGSRALTAAQAILIAAIFEFAGAYFAGPLGKADAARILGGASNRWRRRLAAGTAAVKGSRHRNLV